MLPEPDNDGSKKIFLPSRATGLSLPIPADDGAENPSLRQNAAINSAVAEMAGVKNRVDRLAMENLAAA